MRPFGHRRSAGAVALLIVATLAGPATVNAGDATISINDVVVTETDNPTTVNANFSVTLSRAVAHDVSVDYRTVDGPAAPGAGARAPGDYVRIPVTTLTFTAGATVRIVTVVVRGDRTDEPHERFGVALSSPDGASIADASGRGRILDDDPPPRLSVADATATESNGPSVPMTMLVSLDRASGKPVKVDYATSDDTAQAPDYTATSGTLHFAPGQKSFAVVVPIKGDLQDEIDETIHLTLSAPVGASLLDAAGVGTIDDNDGPGISINDRTVNELGTPNSLLFTVTLSSPSVQDVSVTYRTTAGTATGSDYTAAGPAQLVFSPGQTSKTIPVTVNGDFVVEEHEQFSMRLSAPVDGHITDPDRRGIATLNNDDCAGTDAGPPSAVDLGPLDGDTTNTADKVSGSTVMCSGEADWLRVRLREASSADIDVTARIRLQVSDTPPQGTGTGDLDLCVYQAGGTSLVACSSQDGVGDEVVEVRNEDLFNGADESTDVWVRIKGVAHQVNAYVLTIDGHPTDPVTVEDNLG